MTINCYEVDCTGWTMIHPQMTPDGLGYVPCFLSDDDPRPAREQFNERYVYGGWRPNPGFTKDDRDFIQYPGDRALPPVAERKLRDERIVFYPGAVLSIIQPDGSYEIARLD
ncbi:hypothetical protein C7441_11052 [Pseudaminobacter salicylatoxidans]|uniref:Uncharacterized protein n=1 Tax=Pseudaminobacter salicylatoxidans TaxID=93369 RepID=A0A316C0J0_PSESE|nr:hypothetical protein [Pseudaminobacter salicylatoxidans]PWJ81520.1 hypothetical protein C7441_11052 [Pseudaminobacter salicylatoxidans]